MNLLLIVGAAALALFLSGAASGVSHSTASIGTQHNFSASQTLPPVSSGETYETDRAKTGDSSVDLVEHAEVIAQPPALVKPEPGSGAVPAKYEKYIEPIAATWGGQSRIEQYYDNAGNVVPPIFLDKDGNKVKAYNIESPDGTPQEHMAALADTTRMPVFQEY
tara:strand:- start:209 stop:700 length:492 start_codon:yes stop_codon:yes gene_type:complete